MNDDLKGVRITDPSQLPTQPYWQIIDSEGYHECIETFEHGNRVHGSKSARKLALLVYTDKKDWHSDIDKLARYGVPVYASAVYPVQVKVNIAIHETK